MSSPARGPAPRSHFKTPTRVRVRLYSDAGLSQPQIVKKMNTEHGVLMSQSAVSRIVASKRNRRYKAPGRNYRLSERAVRYVTRLIRQGWYGRRMTYARLIKQLDLKVSRYTLSRALQRRGYHCCIACRRPFISDKQQQKRLDWAQRHVNWTINAWATVIWSNKCSFVTGKRGRLYITRRTGKRTYPDCIQSVFRSGRTSFMVWGAIS